MSVEVNGRFEQYYMVSGVSHWLKFIDIKFSFTGEGPGEMNFAATNMVETWRLWRQNMQLYIDATMSRKTEKEKYWFLFAIGEAKRELIFNTWIWPKVVDDKGDPTDEDEITVKNLYSRNSNSIANLNEI